jgi:outer membrane protein assembly factor BamA
MLLTFPVRLAAGQGAATGGPTIGQIHVTGNHRFSAGQIIAASGLRQGAPASQRALEQAASRLSQTGAFSDVGYQYRALGETWDAEFQVAEAPRFVPCTFDNFLWFSDAELLSAVSRDVPLFDGFLPEGGGMQQEVTAALDKWLRAHQIPGSTIVRPVVDFYRHKLTGYLLRVTGVPMPVVEVQVAGGPFDAAAIRQVARGILDADYSRHSTQEWQQTALVEAFQNEGYLQPRFSEPVVAPRDASGKDLARGVNIKFTATPGPRYSWAGVLWEGNQALSVPELTKLLKLSPGQIARRDKTLQGWDAVHQDYGHRGYLTADVKAVPNYDDRAATVRYDVQITEGPQFVMGELRVDDPSPKVAEVLTAAWPLAQGRIYDVAAEKEFLRTGVGKALAHAGVTRKGLNAERDLHPDTRTVNVLLRTYQ